MLNQHAKVILDTLLPSDAHPALKSGVLDTEFDAFWLEIDHLALPAWRWGFRAALWVANWIAPLLIRRLPPLTQYDRQTRERALAAMEISQMYFLRQMIGLLKTVVCFAYGADRTVREAIGYPHQPHDATRQVSQ